jgi:phage/plasmid-like protein (TIGR03299 family)
MAHHIDFSKGSAAFTFDASEGEAWHKHGNPIPEADANDPAKIAKHAGAEYPVYTSRVLYKDSDGQIRELDNNNVVIRRDTQSGLGIVSDDSKTVQPVEYFEAFRDQLKKKDLKISSAGVLKGGRIVFCNARLSDDHDLVINKTDRIVRYVCIGGGYDGKLANFGYVSDFRTVCWNTLSANFSRADSENRMFRIGHLSTFDGRALTSALGLLGPELKARAEVFNTLAGYQAQRDAVAKIFADALRVDEADIGAIDKETGKHVLSAVMRNKLETLSKLYESGPGADLSSAKGTLWGALNAVTHYVDHLAATRDTMKDGKAASRFASANFGQGVRIKQRALESAMALAGIGAKVLQAA